MNVIKLILKSFVVYPFALISGVVMSILFTLVAILGMPIEVVCGMWKEQFGK